MFPLVTSRVAASDTRPRRSFRLSPAQTIVAGFGLADLVGTGLLMLPAATRDGEGASFVHALFTSTSAVCVTGLVVVDTETYWTPLGHLVILALIQIGGIGIMVFASLVGVLLARRLSVRSRVLAATEAKALSLDDVRGVVRRIVVTSLLIEAALFLVLFPSFALRYGHGWAEGAWYALFHSVSAFNNAGFALYADNLVRFAADPWVCLPICAAVILGGLGFPVLMQLRREIGRPLLWSMNTRLVLFGSVILLVGGTVYITALEWTNPATLGAYDPAARVLIGFFHSVQTRTAGFNSIDVGAMHDETWLGMDVLMFIGGGPAGTAGGIEISGVGGGTDAEPGTSFDVKFLTELGSLPLMVGTGASVSRVTAGAARAPPRPAATALKALTRRALRCRGCPPPHRLLTRCTLRPPHPMAPLISDLHIPWRL